MERWEVFLRKRAYVDAVKTEAARRKEHGEDTSETEIWIKWAEEYLANQNPMTKALPSTEVTEEDLREVDQHFYYSEYRKLQREQFPNSQVCPRPVPLQAELPAGRLELPQGANPGRF